MASTRRLFCKCRIFSKKSASRFDLLDRGCRFLNTVCTSSHSLTYNYLKLINKRKWSKLWVNENYPIKTIRIKKNQSVTYRPNWSNKSPTKLDYRDCYSPYVPITIRILVDNFRCFLEFHPLLMIIILSPTACPILPPILNILHTRSGIFFLNIKQSGLVERSLFPVIIKYISH